MGDRYDEFVRKVSAAVDGEYDVDDLKTEIIEAAENGELEPDEVKLLNSHIEQWA